MNHKKPIEELKELFDSYTSSGNEMTYFDLEKDIINQFEALQAKHEEDKKAYIKKAFKAGCFKAITDLTVVKQDAEKLAEQYYEANNENKQN